MSASNLLSGVSRGQGLGMQQIENIFVTMHTSKLHLRLKATLRISAVERQVYASRKSRERISLGVLPACSLEL